MILATMPNAKFLQTENKWLTVGKNYVPIKSDNDDSIVVPQTCFES